MKLLKVSFKNYKILEENEFVFHEGLNFVQEKNEFGKSTIIEGIVDAFSLSPASLISKTTKGKEIPPVIRINFAIGHDTYELKINAQEGKVALTGKDGTELETPQGIKKFWAQKGYIQFPYILEGLLVLKERDLSIGVNRGLKEIFDTVLRSASVENLERRIRSEFILQKTGLRLKPFGQLKNTFAKELAALEENISSLLHEKEEFEKNKNILDKTREEINTLAKKRKELLQKCEQLKYMHAYLELHSLEQEKEKLTKELENLVTSEKKLHHEISSLTEKITSLKEEIEKLSEEITKLFAAQEKIKTIKGSLENVEKGLLIYDEIFKKETALREFAKYDPEILENYLRDWNTFLQLKKRAQGLVKIISAGEHVFINERPVRDTEIAFQGRIRLKYRDLCLDIFADAKVADFVEHIEKLSQKFDTPENLALIIKKLRELKALYTRASDFESQSVLSEKQKTLKKELKAIETSISQLDEKQQKRKMLTEELTQIEHQAQKRQRELILTKEKIKIITEKIATLEEKIKTFPKDFEEKLSLKTLRAYEKLSLKAISEELSRVETSLSQIEKRLNELEIKRVKFEERIKREPDMMRFEELLKEKAHLEQNILRLNRMEKVLRVSADILSNLNEELNKEYLHQFETNVAKYFSLITGGKYQAVSYQGKTLFFDKESFAKDWEVIEASGTRFHIGNLSDGTKAQLLLAARLALARLFLKRDAFFLFDEPFAYFDADRRKRTLSILENLAASGWQVIVMSAQK